MSSYSIKDLEHLSGIKAHTLRIWEQRYNFIEPKRTDTNIRYYSDEDLKLVLNISTLKENGYKISKIAKMSEDELNKEVLKIAETNLRFPDQINSLTLSMIDMDEDRFENILNNNILKYGFERTMLNVIYPFLAKIGMLWQTGSILPAQEHFISNLIRQKMTVAIDGQYVTESESKGKWLLFLPEGELHELSLMFASYLLRARKFKVIYLGQNLPKSDLYSVKDIHTPDYVLTICTAAPRKSEVQGYIDEIAELFNSATLFVGGFQVIGQDIKRKKNVEFIMKMEDLIDFINEKDIELSPQRPEANKNMKYE
ncbi:MerR family transcriptional regulator [Marivirga arenosa]|uniref:MerR family transcriptional regulator n=1 Tax=Marivirga arenosa TaxID=3059076 RepID=A0AA51R832_9BACT|nr:MULTISPECIES: MerR family transcriptional regulator [unclassified Marivirga]WMN06201.1 MerR family transcriptional regulator [Marivirga sp. ABR2-2]WNB17473.1 MerR family transcriptional regulator [Marivirga sp. BKB1-2]